MIRRRGAGSAMLAAIATTLVVAFGAAAVGCDDDEPNDRTVDAADAYSAAIHWVLADEPADPEGDAMIVYVAAADGAAIDAETQAAVAADLADFKDDVTVRFADTREQAVDVDVENEPVIDDGVLLLVGKIDDAPPPVEVEVDVYRDLTSTTSYLMRIATNTGDGPGDLTVTEASALSSS